MKFVIFVCGLAAVLGVVTAGCGPKQDYCPNNSTGLCVDGGTAPGPDAVDNSIGETIIIGGEGGSSGASP